MSQSEPAKNSEEQELSEWEQDAMKRMESKFSLSPEEESPFKDLKLIHKDVIRGSHFLAYQSEDPEHPICIYSEKNRFRAVISMLTGSWAPDLDILLNLIHKAETEILDSYEEDELDTFGIRVNNDSYVVGYVVGGSSPIVASKDLLIRILEFYTQAMAELPEKFPEHLVTKSRQTLARIRQEIGKDTTES